MTQIETAERNRKILQLARSGKTADYISATMNVNRKRVLQILRAYKVKAVRTSHKLEKETAQSIICELKKGLKQSDIARKLNVSRQYVSQVKKTFEEINNISL